MKVQLVDITRIKPYNKNPRKNENAVSQVADSIKQYGFQQPIVVDKKNIIIVGHTRYQAAKQLKLKKVPVHVADKLTPKQVKAYRIADNKTNEFAEWDYELLGKELASIGNKIFTGFDDEEFKSLLGEIEEASLPSLSADDKGEFEQITFTLHASQADLIREALADAKANDEIDESLNENSNGNALTAICSYYMTAE